MKVSRSKFRVRFFVLTICLILAALTTINAMEANYKPKKLLIVSVTKGFKHQSIPVAEQIIKELGESSGSFTVDFARTDEELTAKMSVSGLKNYDGVLFASPTGELPLPDLAGFLNWIKAGHAFIGIHAATDTLQKHPEYIEMIGGEFEVHGPQLKVVINVEDSDHAATKHFSKTYEVFDEIYVMKNFDRANVHTLLSLDKIPIKMTRKILNIAVIFRSPGAVIMGKEEFFTPRSGIAKMCCNLNLLNSICSAEFNGR